MYQPLIKFHPHPAIITQVLIIFVIGSGDDPAKGFSPLFFSFLPLKKGKITRHMRKISRRKSIVFRCKKKCPTLLNMCSILLNK